jgi:hypothetical protein
MQSREEKYSAAVDRNTTLHERIIASGKPFKYAGKTLAEIKHALGIRSTDEKYDTRIQKLIKLAEK